MEKYKEGDFITNQSFQRFVNENNSEDSAYWDKWLKEHPGNEDEFNQAIKILKSLSQARLREPGFNLDVEFDKLLNSIKIDKLKQALFFNKDYLVWKMAAVLIISFGLGWIVKGFINPATISETVAYNIIKMPMGSKSDITLPDGTKVCLNAGSTLKYATDFNRKSRDIYLEGEAFFEVSKNPEKPFKVNTTVLTVKALGTSFNVKSYPEEKTVETTLISGIVLIEKKSEGVNNEQIAKLKPNQRLTFIKKSGILFLSEDDKKAEKTSNDIINQIKPLENKVILNTRVNTDNYTSWTNNKLIFDNESFQSIAIKLERRYGIKIQFKNEKIKTYCYTGTFEEISIDQALKALSYASPFHFEIKDKEVNIF